MTAEPGALRGQRVLHRTARAVCPRAERRWIDAMFAELDSVQATGRAGWTLGAFAIVLSGIRLRAGTVPWSIRCGILLALGALVLFAMGSRSDVEVLLVDDDVFLQFAWVSGALLIVLGIVAITWIFNQTGTEPRHRH